VKTGGYQAIALLTSFDIFALYKLDYYYF